MNDNEAREAIENALNSWIETNTPGRRCTGYVVVFSTMGFTEEAGDGVGYYRIPMMNQPWHSTMGLLTVGERIQVDRWVNSQ